MSSENCPNCGNPKEYLFTHPIDDDLQETWGISTKLRTIFNIREGRICTHCGANIRAQMLASAILNSKFGFGTTSLEEWVNEVNSRSLAVCEINSCHQLHDTLKKINNLVYAEYGTETEQNIEALTYKDAQFDLVLHSETLEHVSNPLLAMDECRRVIKDDGIVLFTTPVIWSRKTRQRASIERGVLKKLLPESHHGKKTDDYLVFYEYGNDIDNFTGAKIALKDWKHQSCVFMSGKKGSHINKFSKLQLQFLEKIA